MDKTKELEIWEGEFGDAYTDRNALSEANINARMAFWANVVNSGLQNTIEPNSNLYLGPSPPQSIFEVGCNIGMNLIALDNLYKMHDKPIQLIGLEPNNKARKILYSQGIRSLKIVTGSATDIAAPDSLADMVLTCGLLIHINPNDLERAMGEIYRTSKKYIICAEYFSPKLREITYRDKQGLLWADDYGSKWLDNFPVRCCAYGFAWKRLTGMDDLTWWTFEKVN